MRKLRSRGDEAWKMVLGHYFSEFIDFFFPDLGCDIQRGRYDFLDSDLQSLSRRIGIGRRIADRLVRVYLHDDTEMWFLVHVEIQGKADVRFEERMFIYWYRIYDRYRRIVVSLGVLADDEARFRPGRFELASYGCELLFQFPSVKLRDYRGRIDELEQSRNPFAIVVLAHLRHQETKGKGKVRKFWKVSLVKSLDEKGFTGDDREALHCFIDWLLALPENLEMEYIEDMKRYEEERKMAYVTTAERLGIKKGFSQGMEQGMEKGMENKALEIAANMKQEGIDVGIIVKTTGLSRETVEKLQPVKA